MNKWFESKNIANYAKTALLQAQKKIDQVLDIKEDEILAKTNASALSSTAIDASNFTIPSTSTSSVQDGQSQELTLNITNTARLKKSPSNSSIASSTTSNSTKLAPSQIPQENDSFFNTFLSKLDNTSASSSTSKLEQEIENVNFDSFLNQMPHSPEPTQTPSLPQVVITPTKKQQRSSNINKIKSNNLNISSANDAADKQNWIQNYVNSSPTGMSQHQNHHDDSASSSIFTNSSLIISSSSSSSTSTANAPVVPISTSTTSSTSTSTNTTATTTAGLAVVVTTSNEVKIKEESDDVITVFDSNQECASVTTMTSEPLILNESVEEPSDKDTSLVEKMEESITNVKSFTESLEFVS